ncbi:hypothetical protein Tco_0898248 [Tanacetum coccineum]
MGDPGRRKTVLMEFRIVKCRSPYNVIMRRTRMRSHRAVGSTINSMFKFSKNQGVVTMETSREALWEYRQVGRNNRAMVSDGASVESIPFAKPVQMDYSSLNIICAKDMYLFSKVEEELVSLIERGDGVIGIKQRRRDLASDGVRNLEMASGHGRLK